MAAKKSVVKPTAKEVELQMDGFIAKFEPAMQKQIRAVRAALRKRFPTAVEMVYDNYNFFVIGYGTTEKVSDAILSMASNAKGVGMHFLNGAELPDPEGILLGSGSQNRFVRLDGVATLKEPAVVALVDAAVKLADTPLPTAKGYTVVKSVSEKQRPRR